MAIFHLSVKTVSRSHGRSATATAAYRSGERIEDERTGEVHDYGRRSGVESAHLVLPDDAPAWAGDRGKLWNAAEAAENRKNSTVAREFEVALPAELDADGRRELALTLAREIVQRHGCAADVAMHEPGKVGDERNHHAHIQMSTRRLDADGFGAKTRELDDQATGPAIVTEWRERWAQLVNAALQRAGLRERVDHRSLKAQGIQREPTEHLGPVASAIERRTGVPSRKRQDMERAAAQRSALEEARERNDQAGRQIDQAGRQMAGELVAARQERDQADRQIREGRDQARRDLERWRAERDRARAAEIERAQQAEADAPRRDRDRGMSR